MAMKVCNINDWQRGVRPQPQVESTDTIGAMATRMAHDFNNLLTVIAAHTESLAEGIDPADPRYVSVLAIQASARRAAGMTQTLLALGRRQIQTPLNSDVGDQVVALEAELRRRFGRRIETSVAVAPGVWTTRLDPTQVARALATIGARAQEIARGDGAIAFHVGNVTVGPGGSQASPFVREGRYVSVETLCSAESRTDTDAEEVALEMAAVAGMVKQAGGYLWSERDALGVATVAMLLPADLA